MSVSALKTVKGTVVSSQPLDEDWSEEDCLCQGKVPEDKRIDYLVNVFDEKRQKRRWKSLLRYHQDCPIHGIHKESQCRED